MRDLPSNIIQGATRETRTPSTQTLKPQYPSMSLRQPLEIRQATSADAGLVVQFIQELAIVEDFPYPVTVTEADLLVRPQYQGAGYGKAMLKYLAAIAESRKCARFEWWTLRTNERALGFFQAVGARRLEELVIHRTQDAELRLLASNEA